MSYHPNTPPSWGINPYAQFTQILHELFRVDHLRRDIKENDIVTLASIYQGLLTSFFDDVSKYARNRTMIDTIRHAIESAPLEARRGGRVRCRSGRNRPADSAGSCSPTHRGGRGRRASRTPEASEQEATGRPAGRRSRDLGGGPASTGLAPAPPGSRRPRPRARKRRSRPA